MPINSGAPNTQYDQFITTALNKIAMGDLESVAELASRAIQADAGRLEAYIMLSASAFLLDDMGRALDFAEKAHELDPDCSEGCDILAHLHSRVGHLNEGVFFAKLATAGESNPLLAQLNVKGLNDLGEAMNEAAEKSYYDEAARAFNERRFDAALAACEKEIRLNNGSAACFTLMGRALLAIGEIPRAIHSFQAAIHMAPDAEEAYVYLGDALYQFGEPERARGCHDVALDLSHNASWVVRHAAHGLRIRPATWPRMTRLTKALPVASHPNMDVDAERDTIRVGYLVDSVTSVDEVRLIEPLLQAHDRHIFQICIYSDDVPSDTTARSLRNLTVQWVDTNGASDDVVLDAIRRDGLDILVDFTFQPFSHRAAVIAARPATHVLKWGGIGSDVFKSTYDGVLCNAATKTGAKKWGEERLVDGPLFAISPENLPAIDGESPVRSRGHIMFGATCDLSRITMETAAAWARILRNTPESMLMLGNVAVISEEIKSQVLELFSLFGVVDRITFSPPAQPGVQNALVMRRAEFMVGVDVFLDTFPHTGLLELADAAWAGVPVITLKAGSRDNRLGAAIVAGTGAESWIAKNVDDYVKRAASAASAVESNENWRSQSIEAAKEKPLFQTTDWVRSVEDIYFDLMETARPEKA